MKFVCTFSLSFFFLLHSLFLPAQSNAPQEEDVNRIILTVFLPDDLNLPDGAASLLVSRLTQLTTRFGMGGTGLFPRFLIVAKPALLQKEVLSTAPPKHVYTVDLSLFVGDGIQGTLFASNSFTLKGVGETEEKAYLAAFKMLNLQDPRLAELLATGKEKIIAHYNAQCSFILTEARTLASQRKFDEALALLMQVPDVSEACFDSARQESIRIFNQKLELECQQHIASAKALIAQDKWDEAAAKLALFTPDIPCFPAVDTLLQAISAHRCALALGQAQAAWASRNVDATAEALANVPADSKCAGQAKKLNAEIAAKLDAKERAAWNLAYEKYNRNQTLRENEAAHQQSLENRQMTYQEKQGFQLEKSRIQAIREIGVAYGKNQPRRVTYNVKGW